MPISADKAPKNLPTHAKEIWVSAFNSALTDTCKGTAKEKDECAAKIAWSAVKRKYEKTADGGWSPKSEVVTDFSFHISKASFDKKTGEMRWQAVASDTGEDLTQEFMSEELFKDFIRRAVSGAEVPEDFQTDYWKGGMPYVSISHYPDCDGTASAGMCSNLYVDGECLKAKGIFYDTPLGRASFKSVCDSLYGDGEVKKVRISIGFLDWVHEHEGGTRFERRSLDDVCMPCILQSLGLKVGKKKYISGQLIHLALTREPANPRTDIIQDMEVSKSMATQKSDAASIVGDELAEMIEKEASKVVGKSLALVVKAETDTESEDIDEVGEDDEASEVEKTVVETVENEVVEKSMDSPMPYGGAMSFSEAEDYQKAQELEMKFYDVWSTFAVLADNIIYADSEDCPDKRKAMSDLMKETQNKFTEKSTYFDSVISLGVSKASLESEQEVIAHPLDEAITKLKSSFDTVSKSEITSAEKLMNLQTPFEELGQALRSSIETEISVDNGESVSVPSQVGMDVAALKSAFVDALQPLAESMKLLLQYSSAQVSENSSRQVIPEVPVRRSIVARPFNGDPTPAQSSPTVENPTPKLRDIVRRSIMR